MIAAIKRTASFINDHPLAKRHLLTAYFRFFKWQVKTFLSHDLITVPFINNTKFYAKKGLYGITGNIYTGLHEFEDMAFLLHFLKESDTFYDVGSNVGSYTLLASGVKKATTLAFEPSPENFELLTKSISLNALERHVIAVNKGVSSTEKQLAFSKDQDATTHVLETGTDNAVIVDAVPLDAFYPGHKPALMKIDVEGFEYEVLKGASKTLADQTLKAIIIELNGSGNRYGFKEIDIHELLLQLMFKPYTYDPFKRQLTEQKTFGSFNTIYIRDLDLVKDLVKKAASFKIFGELI